MRSKQEKRMRKLYSKSMSEKAWNDIKIVYAKYKKMLKREIPKTIAICVLATICIIEFLIIIF